MGNRRRTEIVTLEGGTRPLIELHINRVHRSAWELFKRHHYLTPELLNQSYCFVAFWRDMPVAFDAWIPFFGKLGKTDDKARRGHRTVCLPDYQGVGIGNALFSHIASMWKAFGMRAFSVTGHPAEIAHRIRSPLWRMHRAPSFSGADKWTKQRATTRLAAGFEYVGPALALDQANLVFNSWAEVNRSVLDPALKAKAEMFADATR